MRIQCRTSLPHPPVLLLLHSSKTSFVSPPFKLLRVVFCDLPRNLATDHPSFWRLLHNALATIGRAVPTLKFGFTSSPADAFAFSVTIESNQTSWRLGRERALQFSTNSSQR